MIDSLLILASRLTDKAGSVVIGGFRVACISGSGSWSDISASVNIGISGGGTKKGIITAGIVFCFSSTCLTTFYTLGLP